MTVYLAGPTLFAPGLNGWEASRAVLAGETPYIEAPFVPGPPAILPPAERRRAGIAIRLAVAAATAAIDASSIDPATLSSVFGSSNGDGAVIAGILAALAAETRAVSPTQFHNSVHNGAAAYWSIGTGCGQPSTSLGCHDNTFAASLLRTVVDARAEDRPVLLCVYDAPLPAPLDAVRRTSVSAAAAMILTAAPIARSCVALDVRYVASPAPGPVEPDNPDLRPLYHANPAARCLRLMEAVARRREDRLSIGYLEDAHLEVRVRPC